MVCFSCYSSLQCRVATHAHPAKTYSGSSRFRWSEIRFLILIVVVHRDSRKDCRQFSTLFYCSCLLKDVSIPHGFGVEWDLHVSCVTAQQDIELFCTHPQLVCRKRCHFLPDAFLTALSRSATRWTDESVSSPRYDFIPGGKRGVEFNASKRRGLIWTGTNKVCGQEKKPTH